MKYSIQCFGLAMAAVLALNVGGEAQLDVDLDALMADLPPASDNAQAAEDAIPETSAPEADPLDVDAMPERPDDVALPEDTEAAADLTAEQERVLRQDREQLGLHRMDEAIAAQNRNEHQKAFELFTQARRMIPDRPATDEARMQAEEGYAEAAYRLARAAFDRDDFSDARRYLDLALVDEDRQGARVRALRRRIQRREERLAEIEARPTPVEQRPELVERRESIEQFMTNGRRYYDAGEWPHAEQNFEQVLLLDPYHRGAMRYLKRIEERRLKRTNLRRESTVADLMRDVRDRWHPPIRREVMAPDRPDLRDPVDTRAQRLQLRMNEIVIPSIEFRQANIVDVIDFLREASVPGDPEGIGVNIILQLERGAAAAPAPTRARDPSPDDWDLGFDEPLGAPAERRREPDAMAPSTIPSITLSLRRVTLLDAIRYVTEVANLRYRIEDNAVIITPTGVAVGTVVTRMYPVQPSILDIVVDRQEEQRDQFGGQRTGDFIGMGGGEVDIRRGEVKPFFEQMGVPFPEGTHITYNPSISQLIVSNTAENLELFERILSQLNVIPNQVEIEARFVEIAQTDLEELGFEWMLTDDYNIATRPGSSPLGMRERIQINNNVGSGGFTSGLRFFDITGNPATRMGAGGMGVSMGGSILSVSSILTNPELSFVLHALRQKGGSDLLSAPRVTTRSGVNAQIQVVQEIIYPSEYMEQSAPTTGGVGTIGGQPVGGMQFRVPYPSSFETREVGVILNVTPTVGPDGYTIDLTLVPEVAELVDWIDYGPPDAFPILKPIFASRNVTTSIVIWDGQTVVMGGLIRDQVQSFDDKIPLLGDLPLIGRLFRSKGQRSQKQNLVVFVTARLVDPAGNPIHQDSGDIGVLAPSGVSAAPGMTGIQGQQN